MAPQLRLQPIDPAALALLLRRPADVARTGGLLRRRGVAGWLLADEDLGRACETSRAARRLGVAVGLRLLVGDDPARLPADADLVGVPLVVLRPAPGLADVVGAAARVSAWLSRRRDGATRVALDGWPRCVATPRGDVDVALEASIGAVPGATPAAAPGCTGCPVQAACPGWPASASSAPTPPGVAVSNQADLVDDGTGALWFEAAEVGAIAAAVLFDDGSGTRRYVCRDPAFAPRGAATPHGLQRELEERGQLWLDVSTKERLDDFGVDLAPLEQLDAGHWLPDGGWMPPRWRRREGVAPFAAEEQWLQDRIAALAGTVVDVGAGPLRYLHVIAPAIASGALRYVAVEPDGAALAALRSALPGAILARGVGEALPLPARCADVVMVLRAWNHLSAPLTMLAEARRVLRPGGALILVDNVAFGLVRSAEAAARAHAIPVEATPFEHFRNDDAAAAVAWLERAGGFRVVERQDVAPGTGNQWFVRATFDGG